MKELRKNTLVQRLSQWMVLMLCLATFSLTSCKDKDTEMLEKIVSEVNDKCPLDINPEIKITKVSLEDKFLTYYFEYSEASGMLPENFGEAEKEALGSEILKAICNFDGQEKKMVDLLLKKDYGMKFVMDFKRSKKQITVKFTADRIRSSRNGGVKSSVSDETAQAENDASSAQDALERDVESAKSSVPMDLGNGITMTDVYLSNGSLYYIYEVDEASVPLESWTSEVMATVKNSLINELKSEARSNPAVSRLIELCGETNTDFVYRYKGDQSGTERDINVLVSELK